MWRTQKWWRHHAFVFLNGYLSAPAISLWHVFDQLPEDGYLSSVQCSSCRYCVALNQATADILRWSCYIVTLITQVVRYLRTWENLRPQAFMSWRRACAERMQPVSNQVRSFTWYNFSSDWFMKRFKLLLCKQLKFQSVWACLFWLRCLYGAFLFCYSISEKWKKNDHQKCHYKNSLALQQITDLVNSVLHRGIDWWTTNNQHLFTPN